MPQIRSFSSRLSTPLTACPLPEQSILNATELLNRGSLCRYGEASMSNGFASQLEKRMAAYFNRNYAIAVNSGVGSLYLSLRACGVSPEDQILCGAFTLSCVPGAIEKLKAQTILVDTDPETLTTDLDHLRKTIQRTNAKYFVLSHMRGHIGDMDAISAICDEHGVHLIEDCAHAIGSTYNGKFVGSFGRVSCFSFQAFKQINAGEMGMSITDDPDICARVIISSGSYMNYLQHGTIPDQECLEKYVEIEPNYSMRASELSAAIALPQIDLLQKRNDRWLAIHDLIESEISNVPQVRTIRKLPGVCRTPSSIQFFLEASPDVIENACKISESQGVTLKWFGSEKAHGFTSRYNHWKWVEKGQDLPGTDEATSKLLDVRLPYSLSDEECLEISRIIRESIFEAVRS